MSEDTALLKEILDRLGTLGSDVATVKADVATVKADVATVKADVATVKADVATIKTVLPVDEEVQNVATVRKRVAGRRSSDAMPIAAASSGQSKR